jgi:hypothetical protein
MKKKMSFHIDGKDRKITKKYTKKEYRHKKKKFKNG